MPIYEYHCPACGKDSEILQKISDPPLVECPHCGKNTLTKMVSAAGFQLKGSDWYATDYQKKSAPKSAEAEAPKSETKTETKTEATPATTKSSDAAK